MLLVIIKFGALISSVLEQEKQRNYKEQILIDDVIYSSDQKPACAHVENSFIQTIKLPVRNEIKFL